MADTSEKRETIREWLRRMIDVGSSNRDAYLSHGMLCETNRNGRCDCGYAEVVKWLNDDSATPASPPAELSDLLYCAYKFNDKPHQFVNALISLARKHMGANEVAEIERLFSELRPATSPPAGTGGDAPESPAALVDAIAEAMESAHELGALESRRGYPVGLGDAEHPAVRRAKAAERALIALFPVPAPAAQPQGAPETVGSDERIRSQGERCKRIPRDQCIGTACPKCPAYIAPSPSSPEAKDEGEGA